MTSSTIEKDDLKKDLEKDYLLNYLKDDAVKLIFYRPNKDDRYYLKKYNKRYNIMKYDRITQKEIFIYQHNYPDELHEFIDEIFKKLQDLNITKYIKLRHLSREDIENFIKDPIKNYYRDIFHSNNNKYYYLFKNHRKTQIELNLNDEVIESFPDILSIDPNIIFEGLTRRNIIYTTDPNFTKPQEGAKKRSKSRVRRKRSKKRKKYKRRHHTYRKSKTKI